MKTCTKCGIEKNKSSFGLRKNKLNTMCRECVQSYWKGWYSKPENKEVHLVRAKKVNDKRYGIFREFLDGLKNKPCMDCGGIFNPWQMDFDHIGEKYKNVGHMNKHNLERVKVEVSKCDLVCANCHRNRTHSRLAPKV